MLKKEYVLMVDGAVENFVLSSRPSGPILSNVEWYEGKRWVPAESVPAELLRNFFKGKKV